MGIPNSTRALFLAAAGQATGGAYEISRSLRFNSADSAYLSRTPGSAGNRKTWTWAGWVKRSGFGAENVIFCSADGGSNNTFLQFQLNAADIIAVGLSNYAPIVATQVFRDPSAWYHLVLTLDTTQATASQRLRLYVNGSEVTAFSTDSRSSIAQNSDLGINQTTEHYHGRVTRFGSSTYANFYLADIHFIDGQALTPSSFTEVSATTGQLIPKEFVASGPNDGTTWSSGASTTNITGLTDLFNGAIGVYPWEPGYYLYSAIQGQAASITNLSLPTGSIRIHGYKNNAGSQFTINGTSTYSFTSTNTPEWVSISETTITSISFNTTGTSYLSAIEVDGVTLIDGDTSNIGLNGFHLPFSDNSTAAALGTDTSGNGNTWTVNNITASGSNNNTLSSHSHTGYTQLDPSSNFVDGNDSSVYRVVSTGGDTTASFTFGTSLSGTLEVLYANGNAQVTGKISIDGGSNFTSLGTYASPTWVSIGTISGNNVQIRATFNSGGGSTASFYGIRVNGTRVVASFNASTVDSLVDTPTSYGTGNSGGDVRGNYCTWNPLVRRNNVTSNLPTFSNGNLDLSVPVGSPSDRANVIQGTIGVSSGKWYFEVLITAIGSHFTVGICDYGITNDIYTYLYAYVTDARKWVAGAISSFGSSSTTNDVLGVAFDLDSGTLEIFKNGSSLGTVSSSLPSGITYFPTILAPMGLTAITCSANFGQRPFAYTAPSGFKALCDTNLPAPVVAQPSTVMDVALDTGANILTATKALCGGNANFLWIKDRVNGSTNHHLIDIVRDPQLDGTPFLASNRTYDETTLGTYSAPSGNSVGWAWYAGTTTASNSDGSITSSVRANASAGFSIVGYTGTSSNATVGHGLGVVPGLLICKSRTQSGGSNWVVWHSSFTGLEFLRLNTTDSKQSASVVFNSTTPTSSVISLGTDAAVNGSGNTHIIYAFAPVAGYSSFGSYVGNGSSDGVFVYTGFRPRWVMIKYTSGPISDISNARWLIVDSARNTYNVVTQRLEANNSGSEITDTSILDFTSNGFKIRWHPSDVVNSSGATYIYAAFAENPFQYARAR